MAGELAERADFFLSRRGSVAAVAQEVADVLIDSGYKLIVQDYDIPLGASFVEAMHEAVKNARDLIILFTGDYEKSPYTRKEFTSFEAERLRDERDRHMVVLRCQDAPLRGLLADVVYQDLVGVTDPEERKRRILAAAERRSAAERPQRRQGRTFVGVPPRIASFTGRVDELDRLDAILIQKRPAAVTQVGRVAVQGMGGVGKTTLAVEYANRFRNLYDGVWWCSAETRASLMASLAALAKELAVASPDEADIAKAAEAALRRLAEHGDIWLLVYDNVASPSEIAGLLPAAGARVLITSRFSDWKNWADKVTLDVLPIAEAVAFLMHRAEASDETGARALAEVLGCLPLALDHAAATCFLTQVTFAEYAAKASRLIENAPGDAPYPRSVAATFDLAIDEAVAQCPAAEALMAFLAYCSPERIPLSLVEGAIDDETDRMAALATLSKVSLVKRDPFEDGTAAVTVHRLVQAVARARAEASGPIARLLRWLWAFASPVSKHKGAKHDIVWRILTRLEAIYPYDGLVNPASWTVCAQLTPHLIASCETEMVDRNAKAICAELLNRAGSFLLGRGAYSEARPLLERALALCKETFGSDHALTAMTLHNYGLLRHAQGELASRPLLKHALKEFGDEYPDAAARLASLTGLNGEGDMAEPGSFFERALAINEKKLGPDHPATARNLNALAGQLSDEGDFARARTLYERALAILETAFRPNHPSTATTLNDLGLMLRKQKDLPGARRLFERALAINEKALGDALATSSNLNNLALVLQEQGDLDGARPLFTRALAIREKALGPDHPATMTVLTNLAYLLNNQADYAGAQPLLERVLAFEEKTLGPTHPKTTSTLVALAGVRRAQGDDAGADAFVARAVRSMRGRSAGGA